MTDLCVGIARYMIEALLVKYICFWFFLFFVYKLNMLAMGRLSPAVISHCSHPSFRRIFYG